MDGLSYHLLSYFTTFECYPPKHVSIATFFSYLIAVNTSKYDLNIAFSG
jgi:hypothetical protein